MEGEINFALVQELLGHKDIWTTMICTHVVNRGGAFAAQRMGWLAATMSDRLKTAYHAEKNETYKQREVFYRIVAQR